MPAAARPGAAPAATIVSRCGGWVCGRCGRRRRRCASWAAVKSVAAPYRGRCGGDSGSDDLGGLGGICHQDHRDGADRRAHAVRHTRTRDTLANAGSTARQTIGRKGSPASARRGRVDFIQIVMVELVTHRIEMRAVPFVVSPCRSARPACRRARLAAIGGECGASSASICAFMRAQRQKRARDFQFMLQLSLITRSGAAPRGVRPRRDMLRRCWIMAFCPVERPMTAALAETVALASPIHAGALAFGLMLATLGGGPLHAAGDGDRHLALRGRRARCG